MRDSVSRLLGLFLGLVIGATALAEESWPQFRGVAQGHSDAKGLPLQWSESQNIKWKTAIPGKGWSSPVVWGDQVWMTTAMDEGKSLHAVCVDRNSGKILFDEEVFYVPTPQGKNDFNSYASPTPVIEAGRVYVSFGYAGSACLDTATGKPLWTNKDLKIDHKEGAGSSPILYKNLFILHCDGMDAQYIVALDKQTGQVAWKTDRSFNFTNVRNDLRKAYGTPLLIQVDGKDHLISIGSRRLYSYDPMTGKELWYVNTPGFSNAPVPVFDGKQIYITTGFMRADLWAIKVTPDMKGDMSNRVAWKFNQGVSLKPSPVVVDDLLYMVSDNGIARCMDTQTGKQVWQSRLGPTYSASPLFADGRLYFFDDKGQSQVLAPGREFKQLAKNELDEGCMGTPAIVGKAFYLRTVTHLYRIETP